MKQVQPLLSGLVSGTAGLVSAGLNSPLCPPDRVQPLEGSLRSVLSLELGSCIAWECEGCNGLWEGLAIKESQALDLAFCTLPA